MRNASEESPGANSGPLVLFQFISLGLIIALGSAGNTLVLYAFSKYLRVRRSPYLLMLGFVCLDLARVCLAFPVLFVTVVHPLRSGAGCQLVAFAHAFCLLGNQLSVLGMSVDRYMDGGHRALYRRGRRGPLGLALLLGVWVLAALLAFPAARGSEQALLEASCTFPYHYRGSYSGLLVSAAAAFALTNLLYFRLYFVLRRRRRMCPLVFEPAVSDSWGFFNPQTDTPVRNRWLAHSLSETPIALVSSSGYQSRFVPTNYDVARWRSKKQKENEKLTKLCFVIHVIFSTMWAPYVGICFYLAYDNSPTRNKVPEWAEISATWLTYIQLTVTPIAFCSFSDFAKNKVRVFNGKRRISPTLSSNSSM